MFEFVLTFALPDAATDPSTTLDALYNTGCNDAVIGVGRTGQVGLAFTRTAASAEDAIRSAIANVQTALPGANLIEIGPDLVNLADIADLIGCSRQNIRKYATGAIKTAPSTFPNPILSGATSYWHLCEVLSWLKHHSSLTVPDSLLDLAKVTADINLKRQMARIAALAA